jgi:LEA14-like dessication related protein
MKMRQAIVISVAALALTGCPELFSVMQKPNVTMKRVDLSSVTPMGLSANFVLAVDNPNPIGLPVGKLDYQLTVDGHALAAGQSSQNLSIPGNGSADVTLPVSVNFAELGLAVESMMTKSELPYTIRAKVGFDSVAGSIEVPIEQSGTFSLASAASGLPRW